MQYIDDEEHDIDIFKYTINDETSFYSLIEKSNEFYLSKISKLVGGNADYYIDRSNKKYNRKILKKDGKKFVRYNNKLVELKAYKETIKKEKQVLKDKLKKTTAKTKAKK